MCKADAHEGIMAATAARREELLERIRQRRARRMRALAIAAKNLPAHLDAREELGAPKLSPTDRDVQTAIAYMVAK